MRKGGVPDHDEGIVSRTDAASSMSAEDKTASCGKLPKLSAWLTGAVKVYTRGKGGHRTLRDLRFQMKDYDSELWDQDFRVVSL